MAEVEFTILLEQSAADQHQGKGGSGGGSTSPSHKAGAKTDSGNEKGPPAGLEGGSSSFDKETGDFNIGTAKAFTKAKLDALDKGTGRVSNLAEMFEYAKSWQGAKYTWGTEAPHHLANRSTGIDCSGFVLKVMKTAGAAPPYDATAEGLMAYYSKHGKELKNPQPGALVFFEPYAKKPASAGGHHAGAKITHVAIYTGNGKIIDSHGGGGVTGEYTLKPNNPKHKYHFYMPDYKFPGGSS